MALRKPTLGWNKSVSNIQYRLTAAATFTGKQWPTAKACSTHTAVSNDSFPLISQLSHSEEQQVSSPRAARSPPLQLWENLKAKVKDSCPRKKSCFCDQSVSRQERSRGNGNVDFVVRCSPGLWIIQYTLAFSHTRHRPYLPPAFQPSWQLPKHRRFFHPLLTTVSNPRHSHWLGWSSLFCVWEPLATSKIKSKYHETSYVG